MEHLQDIVGHSVQAVQLVANRDQFIPNQCTFNKFHEFPGTMNWRICENYTLTPHEDVTDARQPGPRHLGSFLQAWLWFGLIYTVVQDNNGPLLNDNDLIEGQ